MSDFEAEFSDWYVSNKFTKINDSINFNFEESAISYDGFEKFEKEEVYFIVPSKYKGNKVFICLFFGFTYKYIFRSLLSVKVEFIRWQFSIQIQIH